MNINKLVKKSSKSIILFLSKMYFLPSIVALYAKHPKVEKIGILNTFFGWTIIGWIILCIYALDQFEIHD